MIVITGATVGRVNVYSFNGLVAEGAGIVDLGGQFLDSQHDPPLLRQRRQRDFHIQKLLGLDSVLPARTLGLLIKLRPKTGPLPYPVNPFGDDALAIQFKSRKLARRGAAIHSF